MIHLTICVSLFLDYFSVWTLQCRLLSLWIVYSVIAYLLLLLHLHIPILCYIVIVILLRDVQLVAIVSVSVDRLVLHIFKVVHWGGTLRHAIVLDRLILRHLPICRVIILLLSHFLVLVSRVLRLMISCAILAMLLLLLHLLSKIKQFILLK